MTEKVLSSIHHYHCSRFGSLNLNFKSANMVAVLEKKKTLNLPDKNLCHSKSEERNRVKRSYNNNNNSNSWWVWEVESHVILQFPIRATCTSGGTSAVAQGVGCRDCRVSPLIWKDWIEFVIWFNAYTAITIYKGVLVKSSHPNSNPSEQRTWKS